MFCIHRSCELRFLIQSHVNNWQLTLIFHVSFDPLAPETQHRAVDCVFPLLVQLSHWIVLQIFFKPFVTEVTMPCSCFLPYPSICWQAWHVWCLFLSTALTDILMHLAALGFSSDNPVRHALGHFPLVSCPMWVVRCELARNSARIEIALAVVWAFCGLQICAWLCLGNDWVVF